jgi:hypothetical protein
MIVFDFNLARNCISTLFFTLPMMIAVILKQTARMRELIQSNIQFGYIFMVLLT